MSKDRTPDEKKVSKELKDEADLTEANPTKEKLNSIIQRAKGKK